MMNKESIIENLYGQTHTTDVCFHVKDREKNRLIRIGAHKCVLAAQSPAFNTMFYGAAKRSGDIYVSNEYITPNGFQTFLGLFYGSY